jgi:hypothetical protein
MTTEQRLENLERELARVKRRSRWLLATVLLGTGLVFLAAAWMGTPYKALAADAAKAPTIIRANEFILEDTTGKTCAHMIGEAEGPAFRLFDQKGKRRAAISVNKEGVGILLSDENGKMRAALSSEKNGPRFLLYDENGNARIGLDVFKNCPVLNLFDENRPRVGLSVEKEGPALCLIDENNKPRAMIGVGITNMPDGTKVTSPESSIHLNDKEGKTIWKAP